MPKPAAPNRTYLRVGLVMMGMLALFISTAMAKRQMQTMLLNSEWFFLTSSSVAGGVGPGSDVPGIRIEGNHYTPRERILQAFAPDINKSVYGIPLAERRRRLLAIDWLEDAEVLRIWPNQMIVKVRERKPVAFAKVPVGVAGHFRYMLIDAQGVLLGVPRQKFDFSVLTGVTEEQSEPERRTRVFAMQELLRELGPAASGLISEVNCESPQDLRVAAKINGHSLELWLGDHNYLARFQNFANHLDEILRQSDGAKVFDLRLDDRIMTVR